MLTNIQVGGQKGEGGGVFVFRVDKYTGRGSKKGGLCFSF